jgi:arabinogalactan oligomer/maltooligosaccharide transport system substrate-binding protein
VRTNHVRTSGLVALGLSLTLLAACGGGDGSSSTTPTDTNEATDTASPAESAAPTRADADLVIWTDDVRQKPLEGPAQKWGEAQGITVAVQAVSDDLQDAFVTADQLGNGPDVVVGANDWIGNLVQNASIVPVTIPDTSDFAQSALDAMSSGGQLFGVPYAVETLGLFANNALTDNPNPATIEDMVTAGQAGGAENVLCLQVGTTGDAYHMQPFFTSGGGYIFGKNADGSYNPQDIGIDSEGGIAAAKKIGELGAEGVLKTSITGDNSQALFNEGKCAYLVSGPWALADMQTAGIDYTLGAVPGFAGMNPAVPPAGVQGFFVAANGQNPAFAQQFVSDVASSTDITAEMFQTDQRSPAQTSLAEQIATDYPDLAEFGQLMASAQVMPSIPEMAAVWGPLGLAQSQIVDGADPETTIKAAADQIRSALGN